MERLTYKNYIEEYEVNFEKSSNKNWSIAESDTHIKVTGEPIDKLGELEDVLEKYGIENAEELDGLINQLELSQKENQQLKQQLHDLPKKIVRDVADELGDCCKTYLEDEPYIEICIVKGILQTILKKYGWENESDND